MQVLEITCHDKSSNKKKEIAITYIADGIILNVCFILLHVRKANLSQEVFSKDFLEHCTTMLCAISRCDLQMF